MISVWRGFWNAFVLVMVWVFEKRGVAFGLVLVVCVCVGCGYFRGKKPGPVGCSNRVGWHPRQSGDRRASARIDLVPGAWRGGGGWALGRLAGRVGVAGDLGVSGRGKPCLAGRGPCRWALTGSVHSVWALSAADLELFWRPGAARIASFFDLIFVQCRVGCFAWILQRAPLLVEKRLILLTLQNRGKWRPLD